MGDDFRFLIVVKIRQGGLQLLAAADDYLSEIKGLFPDGLNVKHIHA